MQTASQPRKGLARAAYLYLVLPFLIFAWGWLRWYYALAVTVAVIGSLVLALRDAPALWQPVWDRRALWRLALAAAVIAGWALTGGVGRYVFQNYDQWARNTIYDTLVRSPWPVSSLTVLPGHEPAALCYYFGFWLPAALVGKAFGLQAGYAFQLVWAVLGVLLTFLLICAWLRRFSLWALAGMMLFSGLDVIGWLLLHGGGAHLVFSLQHLQWWSHLTQYSAPTTQLFWVYNQAIPAWVCTLLLLTQKDSRNTVFLLGASLLNSTLPFVGMALIAALYALRGRLKGVFTVQNVLGGGVTGLLTFFFLRNNPNAGVADTADAAARALHFNTGLEPWRYALFFVLEAGVYLAFVFPARRKQPLFWLTLAALLALPWVMLGASEDFCMRVSIPFLLTLMLWVFERLQSAAAAWRAGERRLQNGLLLAGLCLTLLVGAVNPLHEFARTVVTSVRAVQTGVGLENVRQPQDYYDYLFDGANFTASTDAPFFTLLCKPFDAGESPAS